MNKKKKEIKIKKLKKEMVSFVLDQELLHNVIPDLCSTYSIGRSKLLQNAVAFALSSNAFKKTLKELL